MGPASQDCASAGVAEAPPAGRLFLGTLLLLTFVMNTLARGVTETFAVFLLPVQTGLGISRADITLTYSVYMLAYGLSAPFAGQLIDRLGARFTYAFGLSVLGLAYVLGGSASYAGSPERRARYNVFEIEGGSIIWTTRVHDAATTFFREVRRERLI